jgi:hypothetical protein
MPEVSDTHERDLSRASSRSRLRDWIASAASRAREDAGLMRAQLLVRADLAIDTLTHLEAGSSDRAGQVFGRAAFERWVSPGRGATV